MSYYFNPASVNWYFVLGETIIAFSIAAIVVVLYEFFHIKTWKVRKVGHILINSVLTFTPYFFQNFFDVVVALLVIGFIVGILSIIPQIQLLQKLIKYASRDGEKPLILLWNVIITAGLIAILFGLFYNHLYVYTTSVLSLSVADALGELIGRPYGKIKYKIFTNKSLEGSIGVFFGAIISISIALAIEGLFTNTNSWKVILMAVVITVTEAFSFRFFDNVSIPCVTAVMTYFMFS